MPASYKPHIASSALTDPYRVCRDLGGDSTSIQRFLGIETESDRNTVPLWQFVDFFEISARDLRCPEFGWAVGADFDLRNLGQIAEFILDAPTLGAALTLFRKAFAMVQTDSEMTLTIEGDEAVLSYRILDLDIWPRKQDAEMTLSVFHQMIKSVAGKDWRPSLVTMEHDTSAIWKNASIGPRCKVDYNAATNSLRFPARLLDQPMSNTDSAGFGGISQAISREAWQLERDAPVTIRVRREILRRLGRETMDQTQIAEAIGLSRRTLRRRLEDENHSFSTILSDCRIRYSEIALRNPGKPLSEISDYLGYSSTSAFERAFKIRKGVTPAQFRRAICPEP